MKNWILNIATDPVENTPQPAIYRMGGRHGQATREQIYWLTLVAVIIFVLVSF